MTALEHSFQVVPVHPDDPLAAPLFDDLAGNGGAVHQRRADRDRGVVASHHQHFSE